MPDQMVALDRQFDLLRAMAREAIAGAAVADLPPSVESLGDLIRTTRAARELTLDQVATACGMTKSHVWELEQNRTRNPTVKAMDGLAKALGLPFLMLCAAALRGLKETS